MKTLPETFYKKIVTFAQKMSVFKKPNKTQKTPLRGGFFRRFFWVLLGGFLWAGFLLPTPIFGGAQYFCRPL
jgi:hypothetical protein